MGCEFSGARASSLGGGQLYRQDGTLRCRGPLPRCVARPVVDRAPDRECVDRRCGEGGAYVYADRVTLIDAAESDDRLAEVGQVR